MQSLTIDRKKYLAFKSNVQKSGEFMSKYTDEEIKNEPMFFRSSYEFVKKNCGPIMKEFLSKVPKEYHKNCIIDSRSHMLMKGFWPCIPGWHHDDVPRTLKNGQPNYHDEKNNAQFIMGLVNSHISPTEFVVGVIVLPDIKRKVYNKWHDIVEKQIENKELKTFKIKNDEILYFDNNSMHRCSPTTKFGWRWFARLTINSILKPENEMRQQVQIYLDDPTLGW